MKVAFRQVVDDASSGLAQLYRDVEELSSCSLSSGSRNLLSLPFSSPLPSIPRVRKMLNPLPTAPRIPEPQAQR